MNMQYQCPLWPKSTNNPTKSISNRQRQSCIPMVIPCIRCPEEWRRQQQLSNTFMLTAHCEHQGCVPILVPTIQVNLEIGEKKPHNEVVTIE